MQLPRWALLSQHCVVWERHGCWREVSVAACSPSEPGRRARTLPAPPRIALGARTRHDRQDCLVSTLLCCPSTYSSTSLYSVIISLQVNARFKKSNFYLITITFMPNADNDVDAEFQTRHLAAWNLSACAFVTFISIRCLHRWGESWCSCRRFT